MESLTYENPTILNVGQDSTEKVVAEMAKRGYKKCLVHYGSGSVKRNGSYDDSVAALQKHNIEFVEFGGQKPNPRYQICVAAVEFYLQNECDCILAVGGGSVNDSAKFIALGVELRRKNPECDIWGVIMENASAEGPTGAAPLFTILTMSATGSECNSGGVISYLEGETLKKYPFGSPYTFPIAAGVSPVYQSTLPPFQTCSGALDIISHVFESYHGLGQMTGDLPLVQMGMIEGLINGVRTRVPQLLENPENLHARTDVIWAAYNGLNYLLHSGATQDWTTHALEHAVSAVTDVTHGIGLATIHIGLWRWMEKHSDKLTEGQKLMVERMKQVIFNGAKDMEEVVAQWRDMLKSWGMPTTLVELLQMQAPEHLEKHNIDELIDIFAENNLQRNFGSFQIHNGGWKKEDLVEILQLAIQ